MSHPLLASAPSYLPDPFLTAILVAVLVRSNALPFSGRIMDWFHKSRDGIEGNLLRLPHRGNKAGVKGGLTIYLIIFATSLAVLAYSVLSHPKH